MKARRLKKVLLTLLAGSLFLSSAACTTEEIINRTAGAVLGAGTALVQSFFLNTAEEVKIGNQVRQQILAQTPIYTGSQALTDYINALGVRIAAQGERKNELTYQFNILQSNEVNAFAAPGGFIFVTTEALKYIRSEAELVAVLGHEMGHVDKKHGVDGIRNGMIAQGLAEGALQDADSEIIKGIATFTLGTILKGFGREQEKESDRVGTLIASQLNYAPDAMTDFLETVLTLSADTSGIAALLTTHPPSKERIALIEQQIKDEGLSNAKGIINKDEYLQKISVLPPKVTTPGS